MRFEAGGTSELDVQQARTLLADTEASIPQLAIQRRQAEDSLSVLLGMPPGDLADLLGTSSGIPAAPVAIAVGIPADLLRRRPDVERAERQVAAQSARIGVAKANLLPRFQLIGSVGLSAEDAANFFEGHSFETFGGPRFDWPILNYGRITNAVRVEDATFQELAERSNRAIPVRHRAEPLPGPCRPGGGQSPERAGAVRGGLGAARITQAIFERNAGSKTDLVQKTQARDQARAAVAQAKANLDAAKLDLSYTHIYAPNSGRIDRNYVDVGNLVGAGEATLLASIVRQDPIYAYFDVSERQVLVYRALRRRGETVAAEGERNKAYMALDTDDGFPWVGEVDYVSNRVNPSTGTMELRAIFPNPDRIIVSGLFVRVRLPFTRGRGLLVPDEAVSGDQGGRYVLVVDAQQVAQHRRVKIGALVDGMRVVQEGLTPEEWVVVNGLQRARPRSKVKPRQAPTTAPPRSPPRRRDDPALLHRPADLRERDRDRHGHLRPGHTVRLPVDQYPQVVPPTVQVATTYPGANAQVWPTRWRHQSSNR